MTRDEAIAKGAAAELLEKGIPTSYTNKVFASNVVAVLEAIGMLKLDEPKAIEGAEDEKLETQFKRDGFLRRTEVAYVFNVLDELNLKIVEK